MILTAEQREKVEQNIRLVQKVINDKVHGPYQLGIYTYDDIFQIGCIGLCKAAATDKGGTFSTYAYRLIKDSYGGMTGLGGRSLFSVDFDTNARALREFMYGENPDS